MVNGLLLKWGLSLYILFGIFSIGFSPQKVVDPPTSNIKTDSLRIKELSKSIKDAYKLKNWDVFNVSRSEQLALSSKLKDTFTLAKTHEYSGAYFRKIDKIDSSYFHFYKSFRLFDQLKDSTNAGRILVNLAILQKNIRDYKGSEDTSLKAILYLGKTNNIRRIASMYNNLGVVYNEQGDVGNAIKYHNKALELRKQIDNPLYLVYSLNNLGKLYKDNGQYDEAINYFDRAMQYKEIMRNHPLVRVTLIDNKTHALFKKGKKDGIIERSMEALSVREKERDNDGIIISSIHLAEYYNVFGNRKKALAFAERAEAISLEIKNFRDYLVSLELVSSMYDSPKAQEHFKKYIDIRDSIDRAAVSHKNQFDRIRFETDEKDFIIQQQSNKIYKKNKTIFFTFIGIALIFISIIAFVLQRKRKNKKLQYRLQKGFVTYLKDKYKLSNQNLEFWQVWVDEDGQDRVSEKLFITVDAVKSRRRSLKNKINKMEKVHGDFDRAKAILLFKKEWDFYKENTLKSQ